MEQWLEALSTAISSNFALAPLLALLAGVLTSLIPCSLSTIPLIICYVCGVGTEPKKAFKLSLVFALGSAVTFTALGVVASLAGRLIGASSKWWYIVLGVLMVLMALQTWEIFNFIPSSYLMSKNTKKGYLGALIAGMLGGVFSSPCATPVLIALLAIVAGQGSLAWGILLLLLYSIGSGALTVILGTSVGLVQKLTRSERYGRWSQVLKIVLGALILLMGFYLFYLGF